jgi:hypothetical protein
MLSYKSILLSTALLYANVHGSDGFANSTDDVRHSYNAGRRLSVGYVSATPAAMIRVTS